MPVLPIIGIVAAVAGTAVSAVGQAKAGSAAESAANYNAQTNVLNAQNTLESGRMVEAEQRYQDSLVLAQGRANVGASGVTLEGSPMDVLAERAKQAEINALDIRRTARLDAQAQLRGAQSDILAGQQAKTASTFGVASTLLTGGAKVASGIIGLKNTSGVGVLPISYPGSPTGGASLGIPS